MTSRRKEMLPSSFVSLLFLRLVTTTGRFTTFAKNEEKETALQVYWRTNGPCVTLL